MNRRISAVALTAGGFGLLLPALAGCSAGEDVQVAAQAADAQPAAPQPDAAPLQGLLPGVADRGAAVAYATMRLADGTRVGNVTFYADPRGTGTVVVSVLDLPARLGAGRAFHGFHVHANDDPSNGEGCRANPSRPPSTWFDSADGHFAAPGQAHGEHRGDLPALYLRRGGGNEAVAVTDKFRPGDVVGRAIMLHANRDNFNNVPVGSGREEYTPNSRAARILTRDTGNAGDRIACGVIRQH